MQYLSSIFTPAKRARQAGFTVLELMVATTIFAIILLVLTAGVMSFSRDYFASITRGNTQTVARSIIDDITKTIQFGQTVPTIVNQGKTTILCLDNVEYLFATGYQVSDANDLPKHQSKYGLIKRLAPAGCPITPNMDITKNSFTLNTATDHELLGKHMRISELLAPAVGSNTYTVTVRVANGDDDLFSGTPAWASIVCKDGSGSQFCAIADLTTTVQQRITK